MADLFKNKPSFKLYWDTHHNDVRLVRYFNSTEFFDRLKAQGVTDHFVEAEPAEGRLVADVAAGRISKDDFIARSKIVDKFPQDKKAAVANLLIHAPALAAERGIKIHHQDIENYVDLGKTKDPVFGCYVDLLKKAAIGQAQNRVNVQEVSMAALRERTAQEDDFLGNIAAAYKAAHPDGKGGAISVVRGFSHNRNLPGLIAKEGLKSEGLMVFSDRASFDGFPTDPSIRDEMLVKGMGMGKPTDKALLADDGQGRDGVIGVPAAWRKTFESELNSSEGKWMGSACVEEAKTGTPTSGNKGITEKKDKKLLTPAFRSP